MLGNWLGVQAMHSRSGFLARLAMTLIVVGAALWLPAAHGAPQDEIAAEELAPIGASLEPLLVEARRAAANDRLEDIFRLKLLLNSMFLPRSAMSHPTWQSFASYLWYAFDGLRLCPEKLVADSAGAGLWPLVVHNRIAGQQRPNIRTRGKLQHADLKPFKKGRQERNISITSSVTLAEWQSVRVTKGGDCDVRDFVVNVANNPGALTADNTLAALLRQKAATTVGLSELSKDRWQLLRVQAELRLLEFANENIDWQVVDGQGTLAARILNLHLWLADKVAGVSENPEVLATLARFAAMTYQEWLALPVGQQELIFPKVQKILPQPDKRRSLIEAAIAQSAQSGDGAGAARWLGWLGDLEPPKLRRPLAIGLLHELLPLDQAHGFAEGGFVRLELAKRAWRAGEVTPTLRYLADALRRAPESAHAAEFHGYIKDFLTYIVATYRLDQNMLALLMTYLPLEYLADIGEVAVWRAAFLGDSWLFAAKQDRFWQLAGARLGRQRGFLRDLSQRRLEKLMAEYRVALRQREFRSLGRMLALLTNLEKQDPQTIARFQPLVVAVVRATEAYENGKQRLTSLPRKILEFGRRLAPMNDGRDDQLRQLKGQNVAIGGIALMPFEAHFWPFEVPALQSAVVFEPIVLTYDGGNHKWRIAS